jgi:hypothetical protein
MKRLRKRMTDRALNKKTRKRSDAQAQIGGVGDNYGWPDLQWSGRSLLSSSVVVLGSPETAEDRIIFPKSFKMELACLAIDKNFVVGLPKELRLKSCCLSEYVFRNRALSENHPYLCLCPVVSKSRVVSRSYLCDCLAYLYLPRPVGDVPADLILKYMRCDQWFPSVPCNHGSL